MTRLPPSPRRAPFIEDALLNVKVTGEGFGVSSAAVVTDVRPGDRAVVVTHHAPSRASLCDRLSTDLCEPWFSASCASDVEDMMSALWGAPKAGYTATSRSPRAIIKSVGAGWFANPRTPRGYVDSFDPYLIVEA